jgi:hypothetical protein
MGLKITTARSLGLALLNVETSPEDSTEEIISVEAEL